MDMMELDYDVGPANNLSCIFCQNGKFKTNERLFKHLLNQHKDSSTICRFCQRCFFSKQDYINHTGKHSNANSHVYKCSICPQSFFSKTFLLEHQKKHSSISNYFDGFMHRVEKVYDDGTKNKEINKNKKSVKNVTVKNKEKLVYSTDCSTKGQDTDPFSSVGDYIGRLARKAANSDDKQLNSIKPKRKYNKSRRNAAKGKNKLVPTTDHSMDDGDPLSGAAIVNDSSVVRDKLMECLEGIVDQAESVKHSIPHITKRYFEDGSEMDIVDLPGEEGPPHLMVKKNPVDSVAKTLYEMSKMQHSLNMLACQECDQLFSNEFFLNRHLAMHTKRNLKYKYLCKYCRARYCTPNRLFAHFSKSHRNETPFSCKICSETFVKMADFSRHIKSQHTNEGIIRFLQDGLIVYTHKTSPAEVRPNTPVNLLKSSDSGETVFSEDLVSKESSGGTGKATSPGKSKDRIHWKGGLLKHWEGGGDKLSSVKGDVVNPEKVDSLNTEKFPVGHEVNPGKDDNLSLPKVDNMCVEKDDVLNPEKVVVLSPACDEICPDNSEAESLTKGDVVAPAKGDQEDDKLNPKNGVEVKYDVEDKSPRNNNISLESSSDLSIELGNALGLVKVDSSNNGKKLSKKRKGKSSQESPIKGKSSRPIKRPTLAIEASDTEESSWDEGDNEPLSVIRKSKNFKSAKKSTKLERCDICDMKLKAASMKKHKQRHSRNHRFHCHLCKLSIKEEFKFHIHMKTHFQNDKFLCICGVRLPNKQLLDEHKRKVHSKDNQTQNLTMIRSVGSFITDDKQNLQSSQVLVKKINEKPRVFNVQSSQGNVADVVKNFIRKVDPRAFGGSVNPSPFKKGTLNFGNLSSPEIKKMNFTIKVISPQEAQERNKIVIKPIPASDANIVRPAFKIQQNAAPKFEDSFSRVVRKADGFDKKPLSLSSFTIGKDANQVGKRKYLKVNIEGPVKTADKTSPVKGLHLVTANPLAHLMGNDPVSKPTKAPSRKGKSFDYESIIHKSLLFQMQ